MNFIHQSQQSHPVTRCPPARSAHLCPNIAAHLDAYKGRLLEQFSHESDAFLRFARLAVNEAESLAWSTPYAHLFLPVLAEEKLEYVQRWSHRQRQVGNGLVSPPPPARRATPANPT